jgi:flagellar capping protein FliD
MSVDALKNVLLAIAGEGLAHANQTIERRDKRIAELEAEVERLRAAQTNSALKSSNNCAAPAAGTVEKDAVIEAARRLVKAKGRYHTEQNYQALVEALRSANLLLAETFISTGKKMTPRAAAVSAQIEQALTASDEAEAHNARSPSCGS